jgi:serine/threonine protein kinase HipA of HipAB toxin-antitoxin module
LIGNADMHLKNWPLLYSDGRKLSLALLWETTLTTVEETRTAWRDHAVRDLIRANIRKTIEIHMETVANNMSGH